MKSQTLLQAFLYRTRPLKIVLRSTVRACHEHHTLLSPSQQHCLHTLILIAPLAQAQQLEALPMLFWVLLTITLL